MQKFALGIFFHIEGAFDSTLCNAVRTALEWKIHRAVKNKFSNGEENGMC